MTGTSGATTAQDEGGGFPLWTVVAILAVGGVSAAVLASPPMRIKRSVERWTAELNDPEKGTIAYQSLLEERIAPEAVPALVAIASDPRDARRGVAVELLGRIKDPRGLPAVLACDDPALAMTRVEALGRLRGEEALVAVLAALRGEEVELKFPALRVLADWKEVPAERLLPDVEPYLRHEVPGLREFAVKFMGARRHGPAVPTLIGLLRDPDPDVRQMCAWALVQIGDSLGVASVDSAVASGAVTPDEN